MLLPVGQNFLQLLYADDLLLLCKARISEVFYSSGVLGKVLFVVWPSNKQGKSGFLYLKGSIANLFSRLVSIMTFFKDENKILRM